MLQILLAFILSVLDNDLGILSDPTVGSLIGFDRVRLPPGFDVIPFHGFLSDLILSYRIPVGHLLDPIRSDHRIDRPGWVIDIQEFESEVSYSV